MYHTFVPAIFLSLFFGSLFEKTEKMAQDLENSFCALNLINDDNVIEGDIVGNVRILENEKYSSIKPKATKKDQIFLDASEKPLVWIDLEMTGE